MARSSAKPQKLFIKVFWGGADLGAVARSLSSVRSVTAGRGFLTDIHSSIWPLRDNVTIVERERGHLYLNPDLPWDGVLHNGKDLFVLDSRARTKKPIEIRPNTTATLRLEDISIAIRTGQEHVPYRPKGVAKSQFKGSMLALIADTPSERMGLISAAIAALIMVGAAAAGLKSREVWRPESLADLGDELKIPYISPTHFQTAPQVIQDKLDRFHYVESVSSYYSDLATMMTNPEELGKDSKMFSESVRQYQSAFDAQREQLAEFTAAGDRLTRDVRSSGGRVMGIPVVRGESLDGSLQRIMNKVTLVQESAKNLADLRVKVGEGFKAEPAYDYGAAQQANGGDNLSDFTKKLGEGFRNALPDEEQQAKEAKDFAIDASAAQLALFGKEYLKRAHGQCCPGVSGIKAGASPIDLKNSESFTQSDEFLASLKASTWGAPKPLPEKSHRIVEPIAGIIDAKSVEKAIASGRFQLQLCFELALRRNQAAKGNMEWKWQIDTRGKINGLSLLSTTLKDEELIHCVRTRIAGWKFPKPKGGSVEIRYPFEFERDKG